MKKIISFLLIVLFIIFIPNVYADFWFDGVGIPENPPKPPPPGTPPSTSVNLCTIPNEVPTAPQLFVGDGGGGLRYSIVDKDGNMAQDWGFDKSYSFLTFDPGSYSTSNGKWNYNGADGDTSKKGVSQGHNFELANGNPDWKSFDALIAQYNATVNNHQEIWNLIGERPNTGLSCSRQRGSSYKNNEYECFNFFRKETNVKKFIASTIALLYAIKEVYGEDTTKLTQMARKICDSEISLYVIVEPMLGMGATYYVDAGYSNVNDGFCSIYCNSEVQHSSSCPPSDNYCKTNHYNGCLRDSCHNKKKFKLKKGGAYVLGTISDIGQMFWNSDAFSNIPAPDGAVTTNERNLFKITCNRSTGEITVTRTSIKPTWDSSVQPTYSVSALNKFAKNNRFERELHNGEFWYLFASDSPGYSSAAVFETDRLGVGMWALGFGGDGSDICGPACSYDNGNVIGKNRNDPNQSMIYNSSNFPNPEGKYRNLADFTFDAWDLGGLDCCYSFEMQYPDLISNNPEWQQAFNEYCGGGGAMCRWNPDTSKVEFDDGTSYSLGTTVDGMPLSRYAFEVKDCCESLASEVSSGALTSWQADYQEICMPNCCTIRTITDKDIQGDVHNCCLDDAPSTAEQVNLKDMFCKDEVVQVEGYFPVCGADDYYRVGGKEGKIMTDNGANEYCHEYCTERALIETPPEMTAYTGRYFTLSQLIYADPLQPGVFGKITGPWYRGFKRCRVVTAWDKWIKAYDENLKLEIQAYNEYAKIAANFDLHDSAYDNQTSISYTASLRCEWESKSESQYGTCVTPPQSVTPCTPPRICTSSCDPPADTSKTIDVNVKVYTFDAQKRPYYEVKVDETQHDYDSNIFDMVKIIQKPGTLYVDAPNNKDLKVVYNIQQFIDEYNSYNSQHMANSISGTGCSSGNVSCAPKTCTVTLSSGSPESSTSIVRSDLAGIPNYDLEGKWATIDGQREAQAGILESYINEGKRLETKLDECERFFNLIGTDDNIKAKNPDNQYKLSPEVEFTYTQVYLAEEGEKRDEIKIPFINETGTEDNPCDYTGPWIAKGPFDPTTKIEGYPVSNDPTKWGYIEPDKADGCDGSGTIDCDVNGQNEIFPPNYSLPIYSRGYNKYYEEMANFGKKPDKSTYENGYIKDGEFTKILRMAVDGKNYFAEKKFTEDAKYRADCRWNDDTNTEYTLMPSGLVSGDNIDTSHYRYISTDKNVTRHEREYHIHMTTYEGTYETHWYIKGIGEKVNGSERGRFDSFLEENGSTCSVELGETPAEGGLMTCTLKIEDFTVGTRYCPPVTTTNYGDCTPEETLIPALMFKIIDPENPFPNTTMTTYGYTDQKSGETYAYNWVTEEGQNVMNQILTKAPGNNTYHPDNIPAENGTFELSPKTVIAIQEYNAKSRRFGSYTDFTLTCECPDPPTIMTEENNQFRRWAELSPEEKQGFCGNCKSDFLTKLNEFITSGNQTTITYPESLGDAE